MMELSSRQGLRTSHRLDHPNGGRRVGEFLEVGGEATRTHSTPPSPSKPSPHACPTGARCFATLAYAYAHSRNLLRRLTANKKKKYPNQNQTVCVKRTIHTAKSACCAGTHCRLQYLPCPTHTDIFSNLPMLLLLVSSATVGCAGVHQQRAALRFLRVSCHRRTAGGPRQNMVFGVCIFQCHRSCCVFFGGGVGGGGRRGEGIKPLELN